MSLASKYIFDPLKALLAGNTNALSQLGSAQTTIDNIITGITKDGVAAAMAVLPGQSGLKIEILTDIIAGLNTELVALQHADLTTAPTSSTSGS